MKAIPRIVVPLATGVLAGAFLFLWAVGYRTVGAWHFNFPSDNRPNSVFFRELHLFHGVGTTIFSWSHYEMDVTADPGGRGRIQNDWESEYSQWPVEELASDKRPGPFFTGVTDWRFGGFGLYDNSRQGDVSHAVELPLWLPGLFMTALTLWEIRRQRQQGHATLPRALRALGG